MLLFERKRIGFIYGNLFAYGRAAASAAAVGSPMQAVLLALVPMVSGPVAPRQAVWTADVYPDPTGDAFKLVKPTNFAAWLPT